MLFNGFFDQFFKSHSLSVEQENRSCAMGDEPSYRKNAFRILRKAEENLYPPDVEDEVPAIVDDLLKNLKRKG